MLMIISGNSLLSTRLLSFYHESSARYCATALYCYTGSRCWCLDKNPHKARYPELSNGFETIETITDKFDGAS